MTTKPEGRQFDAAALAEDTQGTLAVPVIERAQRPQPEPQPEPEAQEEAHEEAQEITEAQLAFQRAVLDTQASPETILATYRDHLAAFDEQLAYERKRARDSGNWKRYMKLRAMRAHVPAKVTQLLGLAKYPDLFTEYWIEVDDQQGARVWAYVYASPDDFAWATDPKTGELLRDPAGHLIPGGKYRARDVKQVRAGGSRGRDEDHGTGSAGGDYLEKAITGARQRALKQLGVGTAAGIAALEDIQADEKQPTHAITPPRAPITPPTAPAAPEGHQEPQEEPARDRVRTGGRMAEEAEQFREYQKRKQEALERARERFLEYLGKRSRVLAREEVEAVYGPIHDMTVEDMKRVHAELEQFRSRTKWRERLEGSVPPAAWRKWRDWPGGNESEQAQGFLQAVHDALPEEETEQRQAILEAIAAAGAVSDDLALLPAAQQVDALMQGALAGISVDLDSVEP